MKKKILIYAIGITGIISSSLFVMSAVIYKNTLHNSGNWINKKTRVSRAVAGAASFMNTMPALSKFRLNLSKWQGYHELVFNKELSPELVLNIEWRISSILCSFLILAKILINLPVFALVITHSTRRFFFTLQIINLLINTNSTILNQIQIYTFLELNSYLNLL
ncbi:MAG: hypothetical protein IPQ05_11535 [Leptospiraceae bacterium]|nr:hypothetical protein [Leptospiraceae bacterium]